MPAGRPTKLTPEAIETAKDYINGGYEAQGDAIPSHVGIALLLNVTRSTIYKWAEEENSEFSDILEACNQKQHQLLISKGLLGDFNASITKLVLGKHGYHERQEVTGADGNPVKVDQTVTSVTFTGPESGSKDSNP